MNAKATSVEVSLRHRTDKVNAQQALHDTAAHDRAAASRRAAQQHRHMFRPIAQCVCASPCASDATVQGIRT